MRRICLSTVDIRMKNISEKKMVLTGKGYQTDNKRCQTIENTWMRMGGPTQSLIPSSSDAKSNLSCPSTSLEQGGLTKKAAISVKYKSELKKTTIN